jgi:hypothetical protein
MSDTPRTDQAGFHTGAGFLVTATFCRQLERELTAAQIGAARYEYLRRLNSRELFDLYYDCLIKDLNFDAEVDRRRAAK